MKANKLIERIAIVLVLIVVYCLGRVHGYDDGSRDAVEKMFLRITENVEVRRGNETEPSTMKAMIVVSEKK